MCTVSTMGIIREGVREPWTHPKAGSCSRCCCQKTIETIVKSDRIDRRKATQWAPYELLECRCALEICMRMSRKRKGHCGCEWIYLPSVEYDGDLDMGLCAIEGKSIETSGPWVLQACSRVGIPLICARFATIESQVMQKNDPLCNALASRQVRDLSYTW